MPRLHSRAHREAAFLALATDLYASLEDWHDQHPAVSFGEMKAEARRVRGMLAASLQMAVLHPSMKKRKLLAE